MRYALEKLNQIGEARGSNEKREIAKTLIPHDNDVSRVVQLALDPMKTYNVGKKLLTGLEQSDGGSVPMTVATAEALLGRLAARELTGNALKGELQEVRNTYDAASWEMLRRVLLKDLRIGASEKLFNEICNNFIKTFSVNLAHKYERKRIKKFPVALETKHDGVRVVTVINLGTEEVRFFSRTGKEFTAFAHLEAPCLKLAYGAMGNESRGVIVLDSEVLSGSFNKTVSEVRKKDVEAIDAFLMVFEVLSGEEFFNGCTSPLSRRRQRAEAFFKKALESEGALINDGAVQLIPQELVHNFEEIDAIYQQRRDAGFEGIIVKPLDGIYQNKRTYGYLKLKAEETEDATIVDIFEGEVGTKYEGMAGGVIVRRETNSVLVRVGGGWTDLQRAELWADFKQIPVTYQALIEDPETGLRRFEMVTVEPKPGNAIGRVLELLFHEETPDGSLRHPRAMRFRDTLGTGEKE